MKLKIFLLNLCSFIVVKHYLIIQITLDKFLKWKMASVLICSAFVWSIHPVEPLMASRCPKCRLLSGIPISKLLLLTFSCIMCLSGAPSWAMLCHCDCWTEDGADPIRVVMTTDVLKVITSSPLVQALTGNHGNRLQRGGFVFSSRQVMSLRLTRWSLA